MNFPKDIQNDLKVNSKKSFNIVVNSNNKISGNNNDADYYFDWSILPNVNYNVYFSFVSEESILWSTNSKPPANIFINFGVSTNSFLCSSYGGASTSYYIGSLRKTEAFNESYYLFSDKSTNPPIYLNGKPTNNNFQVNILSDSGAKFDLTLLDSYILTLYFEPV